MPGLFSARLSAFLTESIAGVRPGQWGSVMTLGDRALGSLALRVLLPLDFMAEGKWVSPECRPQL